MTRTNAKGSVPVLHHRDVSRRSEVRFDETRDRVNLALGARLSIRGTAEHILSIIDSLSEQEFHASGWTRDNCEALKHLAAIRMKI